MSAIQPPQNTLLNAPVQIDQGLNPALIPSNAPLAETTSSSSTLVSESMGSAQTSYARPFSRVETLLNKFLINAIGISYISCIALLMVPSMAVVGAYMYVAFAFLLAVGVVIFVAETIYHHVV